MFKKLISAASVLVSALSLSACATVAPSGKDYSTFRADSPRSILVVPALNNSPNVNAPEFFHSTVSRPFGDRGYYVFPAHMVKRVMEDEGLADPGLIHSTDPTRLHGLFGCDAVLYVTIQKWESKYVVLATNTTVEFDYSLKSCKTGAKLWDDKRVMVYSPQANNSSGNLLADLLAQALISAIEKGMPNYIPLTQQANLQAAALPGQGLPAGPYLPSQYGKDTAIFKSGSTQ
jgi:hypothetical protein